MCESGEEDDADDAEGMGGERMEFGLIQSLFWLFLLFMFHRKAFHLSSPWQLYRRRAVFRKEKQSRRSRPGAWWRGGKIPTVGDRNRASDGRSCPAHRGRVACCTLIAPEV
jgi:hypothetical protein